jgi:hypothetical protein
MSGDDTIMRKTLVDFQMKNEEWLIWPKETEFVLASDHDRVVNELQNRLDSESLLKHPGYSVIENEYFQNLNTHASNLEREVARLKEALRLAAEEMAEAREILEGKDNER